MPRYLAPFSRMPKRSIGVAATATAATAAAAAAAVFLPRDFKSHQRNRDLNERILLAFYSKERTI